jgi:hypothetical protein
MNTTHTPDTTSHVRTTGALAAMYAGLLLTVVAAVAPYVDRATGHVLADHIRHGYPTYPPERVDSAVGTWLAILTVVGALGIAGWVTTIWAVGTHKPWARSTATVIFLAGTSVALTALLTKDSSGEVGLAPVLGWLGMLPSVAGLVAVALLWRQRDRAERRS